MDTNTVLGFGQSLAAAAASSAPVSVAAKNGNSESSVEGVVPSMPSRKELEDVLKTVNEAAQSAKRNLDFSIDEATGETVVKVIATDSGEVIRQIPSEVMLRLAENFKESNSLLLNEKI
ncbi:MULTISPECIES: flagellar protein FlaG [Pseudomonas]|uniref:flagellar protein FlaG n=1 Tax=Pseudomonas TaxID=286 RepID=UPI0028982665|nr:MULTISPECIES: flagellar protein FlaG [Pseudomonas]